MAENVTSKATKFGWWALKIAVTAGIAVTAALVVFAVTARYKIPFISPSEEA